jgi:hypothetical protein
LFDWLYRHGVCEPLLANPKVKLLKVSSPHYYVLRPDHPYHDYYGYSNGQEYVESDDEIQNDGDTEEKINNYKDAEGGINNDRGIEDESDESDDTYELSSSESSESDGETSSDDDD